MNYKSNNPDSETYSSASHGERPSSWQNPPQGPTTLSALSESQRLFIKLMRHIEKVETKTIIEAMNLPLQYTGQNTPFLGEISTVIEWRETLHTLLDTIEKENDIPFADNYLSALFSYNFVADSFSKGYGSSDIQQGSPP